MKPYNKKVFTWTSLFTIIYRDKGYLKSDGLIDIDPIDIFRFRRLSELQQEMDESNDLKT